MVKATTKSMIHKKKGLTTAGIKGTEILEVISITVITGSMTIMDIAKIRGHGELVHPVCRIFIFISIKPCL